MNVKNIKVYVGLSGGVDSSVSALLLKQQGYDVTGVFIKGWQPDWIPCTWKDDRISAMRTAAYLDISFITLDLESTYKNKVVNYILDEYAKGNTPNPDMLCNREVKFGEFLKWAMSMGVDKVAMGHYAQVQENTPNPSLKKEGESSNYVMKEGADKEKDQTYFLSQLTQKELSKTLFPIGHLQKSEVRKIASVNNLPVATRKDSQGICFVGDLEMKDFLKRELNPASGNVVNEHGEVIGEHDGAILYTIGERHGFRIFNHSTNQNVFHVVDKKINENILVVSSNLIGTWAPYQGAGTREAKSPGDVTIKNISFTQNYEQLQKATNLSIRIRYRGVKIEVLIDNYDNGILKLKTKNSENLNYASGQFAVFYDGQKCLGGGELV